MATCTAQKGLYTAVFAHPCLFVKCLWSKHQDFAKASACLGSTLGRERVAAVGKIARAMLDASSSRPGCSSCVGDVEILIPSGGLSAADSVDAGAGQLLVAWWLSCRSAWQCRQVGPSLITVEADEARAAECSRHISSRPGPSSCVGVVEILIASGSSSAADPVDAWGCCRRCCHVNARASRWRPVSCRWWSGCRTGE